MKTVEDVWELLRREVSVREAADVDLPDALGGVLREDVRAPEDQPAFDRSAVDGFVVGAGDSSEDFCLVGEIRAGMSVSTPYLPDRRCAFPQVPWCRRMVR